MSSDQRDYVHEVKELEEYVDELSKERHAWESNCLKMLCRDHVGMNEKELEGWLLWKIYDHAKEVCPPLCKTLKPLLEKSSHIRIIHFKDEEIIQYIQVGKSDDKSE